MKNLKTILPLLLSSILAAALATSCRNAPAAGETSRHPQWSYNTVMYEVNVRQFSPEGTFAGVQAQLPRLRKLGVDILWFMPIYEIGKVERKGTLGSYYAISDYTKVNPEFGTMEDFERLLKAAHSMGFKVILDWVANQTAPDHVWMSTKDPDFYERNEKGEAIYEYDWTDTRSLNYENEAVWAAQDECMRFWLDKGVDGFRCDAAAEVPAKFWKGILPGIRADYPDVYLLAEAESKELLDPSETFDASYAWKLHHLLNDIAQGKKGVSDLRQYLEEDDREFGRENFRLMFTSNHDENSWSGSEFERMGDAALACAVLCFTLPKGQPLIYTGQEIGLTRRLEFFEKDPITSWEDVEPYTGFYTKLVALRHDHPSLDAGEKGAPLRYIEGVPEGVMAFTRGEGQDKVTVVVNLTSGQKNMRIPIEGNCRSLVSGKLFRDGDTALNLRAWDYEIIEAIPAGDAPLGK